MAAFDFPNTPNVGDLFQDASSGAVYRWNGYAWIGGVTGIGLQTIKETRYLVAGSFTHTRDPKSNGFADLFVLGACGGRPAITWTTGAVLSSGGATPAYTVKWRYPLNSSSAVVVGASSTTANGAASSFDGVITANGGNIGATLQTAAGTANALNGGAGGVASSSGDENYGGILGACVLYTGTIGFSTPASSVSLNGVVRRGAYGNVATTSITAIAGDPGFVIVREYLNP
jgi:hypothetical protein